MSPPHRYNSHMQNQTPAANSQAKFHISPQEASNFTNIPHSKIFTNKIKRAKTPMDHYKYPNYALKGRPTHQKIAVKSTR